MRSRFALLGVLAFAIVGLTAPGASAATTVGNTCIGNRAESPPMLLTQLSSTSNPGAVSVPVSGVITKWGVNVIPYPGGISEKLVLLRPAGGNNFTNVGESSMQPIIGGVNSFETRIPVQAGDHLGAFSSLETIFCGEGLSTPTDVMGFSASFPPSGGTASLTPQPEGQVAIFATVEPDVDGDGFGDETQDKCPQSASFQIECPQIVLDEFALAGKAAITALVISSYEANVTVSASTRSGKAAKRHALKGAAVTLKPVTKKVVLGKLSKFKLPFTKQLRSALGALPPGKSLKLHVTASAKNVIGQVSTVSKTVRVK